MQNLLITNCHLSNEHITLKAISSLVLLIVNLLAFHSAKEAKLLIIVKGKKQYEI